jgi:LysM repeat protein
MMFKLRTLVLLPIVLFACRPMSGELPAETAVPDSSAADAPSDSPRLTTDGPPAAPGLPPTWTPQPVESNPVLPQTSDTATDSGANVEQGTAVPAYTGSSISYVVKRGDTLAEICIGYSVPITEVARINNITDWDHIEVGQVLTIPSED